MTAEAETKRNPEVGTLIVHPLPLVRAGLALLVDRDPGFHLIGEVGAGAEALALLKKRGSRRNVLVVVDLRVEGDLDSYALVREIRDRHPHARVLASAPKATMTEVSRSLFVGADGFVDQFVGPEEFLSALGRSARGEAVLAGTPSEWLGPIAERIGRLGSAEPLLTDREKQVLAAAAEGMTARRIGEELGLAERTITTHLSRIYGKLGVSSRVAAISAATQEGILV